MVVAGRGPRVLLLRQKLVAFLVVRVEKDELLVVAGHRQTIRQLLNVVVKLLQNKSSSLLRNFKNQALWLLNVESSHEHARLAGTNLNYIVASSHALALFEQDDSVFVKDAGLSVDHRPRLC